MDGIRERVVIHDDSTKQETDSCSTGFDRFACLCLALGSYSNMLETSLCHRCLRLIAIQSSVIHADSTCHYSSSSRSKPRSNGSKVGPTHFRKNSEQDQGETGILISDCCTAVNLDEWINISFPLNSFLIIIWVSRSYSSYSVLAIGFSTQTWDSNPGRKTDMIQDTI